MDKTYLDELVEYPAIALREVGLNKDIAALLTDNPNLDMESDEAYDIFDKFLFDYLYVDTTTSESHAYICIEAESERERAGTMQNLTLYVTVICHKNFMEIDPKKFKGLTGNRRDNLVRYIDHVLNGSDLFGIGALSFDKVRTIPSPAGFSAREITYSVPNYLK